MSFICFGAFLTWYLTYQTRLCVKYADMLRCMHGAPSTQDTRTCFQVLLHRHTCFQVLLHLFPGPPTPAHLHPPPASGSPGGRTATTPHGFKVSPQAAVVNT